MIQKTNRNNESNRNIIKPNKPYEGADGPVLTKFSDFLSSFVSANQVYNIGGFEYKSGARINVHTRS